MKSTSLQLHPLLEQTLNGATPTLEHFVAAFGHVFDLLHRLKDTPQDAIWHAEGDVFVHTEMVLAQVYKLLETSAKYLSKEKRLTLILGALFHDIAKPMTSRVEIRDGRERITSPGHADKGRSYLAYTLLELGLSPVLARAVMALVGHHHDPKKLVKREQPERGYRALARLVDLELVYFLEQADLCGRICPDLDEQLELLELFKLYAEESKAWGVTDPYSEWRSFLQTELCDLNEQTKELVIANAIRDAEAGLIFTPHEAIARSYEYRDGFSHLIVTCGPSGSGKSTWINKNFPEYKVISLDDLREELSGKRDDQSMNGQVVQAAREQLKAHLRKHEDVIWDATSLFRTHRSIVLQLGFDYKAFVSLAVFHLPESLIEQRNRQRQHAVPTNVLTKQLQNTDFPYLDEAHNTIYIDHIL
ncbi:MAG: AAA family ATPase [Trueperaceae bacterium]